MITKGYFKNKEVAHKLSVLCIKPYCTCNTVDVIHCTALVRLNWRWLHVIYCPDSYTVETAIQSICLCFDASLSLPDGGSYRLWGRCSVLCHLRCVHTPAQVFHDVNSQEEELRHHLHPILIDVNWFNVVLIVLALNVFRIRLLSLHHVVRHSSSSL